MVVASRYHHPQNNHILNISIARLWCAFTTPNMAIAYASSKDPKAKVFCPTNIRTLLFYFPQGNYPTSPTKHDVRRRQTMHIYYRNIFVILLA